MQLGTVAIRGGGLSGSVARQHHCQRCSARWLGPAAREQSRHRHRRPVLQSHRPTLEHQVHLFTRRAAQLGTWIRCVSLSNWTGRLLTERIPCDLSRTLSPDLSRAPLLSGMFAGGLQRLLHPSPVDGCKVVFLPSRLSTQFSCACRDSSSSSLTTMIRRSRSS